MAEDYLRRDIEEDYGEKLNAFLKKWFAEVDFTGKPCKKEIERGASLIYKHDFLSIQQGFGEVLGDGKRLKVYYAPDPKTLIQQIGSSYNLTGGNLLTPLLPADRGDAGTPFNCVEKRAVLEMMRARLSVGCGYPTTHLITMEMVENRRLAGCAGFGKGFLSHYGCGWLHPTILNILTDEFIRTHMPIPKKIFDEKIYEAYRDLLQGWVLLSKNAAGAWPFKNVVFVLENPKTFKTEKGIMHCETGPALSWGKGDIRFVLNGVEVPRKVVELPPDAISVEKHVLNSVNVDVRREVIRKIGIERVIQKLDAKVISKSRDKVYELLEVDFQEGWGFSPRKYLKMLNPSIGTYHVEAVHPDCETVKEALSWRNKTRKPPKQLT